MELVMGLFGKDGPSNDPKEKVRQLTRSMRHESRGLDRQIRGIEREEEKAKRSLREAAKRGDKDVCRILAKEVINARKAVAKMYTSKAHINSVIMHMNNQISTMRMVGSLQKSTEVMKSMNALMKMPEIRATMEALSKEMLRAGIMEEMIEDTMEMMEPEEMEEEADAEIEKILWEITDGQLGLAPDAVKDSLPPHKIAEASVTPAAELLEDSGDLEDRLEQLRS